MSMVEVGVVSVESDGTALCYWVLTLWVDDSLQEFDAALDGSVIALFHWVLVVGGTCNRVL